MIARMRRVHSQYKDADDVSSGTGLSGKLFAVPPPEEGVPANDEADADIAE